MSGFVPVPQTSSRLAGQVKRALLVLASLPFVYVFGVVLGVVLAERNLRRVS